MYKVIDRRCVILVRDTHMKMQILVGISFMTPVESNNSEIEIETKYVRSKISTEYRH